ncbi:MAG: enoyl-CoA hydratase/isomerase family protein [Chloracidobacterium sp.]|nr:enoyl-CoA hydratase/isomerase family protein [Chloracidobacterium sp.]
MSNELNIELKGDAMIVRFTRPEIRNPLSVTVLDQLHAIVDDLAADSDVEKLVFTGSGDSFASGADLREIASVLHENAHDFARYGQSLTAKVSALPQTTIAAINGWCFGGALDLALSCDFRIASPKAKFAHPGAGLGIITGWGGTQRLPRLVGTANANEMFFTASPIDAEWALRVGLVDMITEDVVAAALSRALH